MATLCENIFKFMSNCQNCLGERSPKSRQGRHITLKKVAKTFPTTTLVCYNNVGFSLVHHIINRLSLPKNCSPKSRQHGLTAPHQFFHINSKIFSRISCQTHYLLPHYYCVYCNNVGCWKFHHIIAVDKHRDLGCSRCPDRG